MSLRAISEALAKARVLDQRTKQAPMKVRLDYGRKGLLVDLPDATRVVAPRHPAPLADEASAIRGALRHPIGCPPLASLLRPGNRVVISHSDISRATPNDRILSILLQELESAGIASRDITLLNGLGTHRQQTPAELRQVLGDAIVDHYRCVQHENGNELSLVSLGRTSFGNAVRINRLFAEADVRILTGFIEPHHFAGFSGGPKGAMPALAGAECIQVNHGYSMLSHPRATYGITAGNPVWEDMLESALLAKPTFLLNVTLDRERRLTGVFAGDMVESHRAGCEFLRKHVMVAVDGPFDLVITTNAGYPLDRNLYQCNKGMRAASNILREGGTIILAAACEEGLPEHGQFAKLLRRGGSPQGVLDLLAQPGFHAQGQWAAQIQAMVQLKGDVRIYSDGLTDTQIREALLQPCQDIESAVAALRSVRGPDLRIAVLPEGPQTIPYVRPGSGSAGQYAA